MTGDPTLRALLEKVAINGEVLVAGEYTRDLHSFTLELNFSNSRTHS